MSGPKVSVYDLTPAQRAIIAAELQRRMRELEKRQELLKQLHTYLPKVEQLSQSLSKFNLVAQEETIHLESSSLSIKIKDVAVSLQELTELMSASADLQDNAKLEKSIVTIESKVKQIQTAISVISKQAASTTESLQEVLSTSITNLFEQQEKSIEKADHEGIRESQLSTLLSYANHKYLPESLRQKIASLNTRKSIIPVDSMDSFFAVEVQPVVKECEEFCALWEKYGAQYELLLERYEILAKENGKSELSVVPFSAKAIDDITRLIAIEEVEYQQQAEDAYIADSISAVMEEMGYNIRGKREVTRRNGSHYSSSLFQYDQDAAVNVIFSDDGKITMEVGKTDTCDRIPEHSESQEIVEKMKSFCTDFAEIESRLAARGVVVKNRISLCPPTVEYAQIINVSDFTATATKSVARQKRKTGKNPQQRSLQS